MIEIQQLTKTFGSRVAVDRLTFAVPPGRVTGFLGPNGAGKSTTLRMVLGLDAPTSGTARVRGRRYAELRDPLRTVGALLDANAVHGGRTARDHLFSIAQSNRIAARRVDAVLDQVGLAHASRTRIRTFSLSMKQRLGIASALLGDPEILIFDEPVNGLDPEGIHWIRGLLRSLAEQGRTVFLSSHLISEMALTADHLIVIGRGRLIADTGVAELVRTSEVVAFASFLAGQLMLSTGHIQVSLAHPGVLRGVIAAGAYLPLVALVGLGLGTLIRHTAGALAALFGLLFLVPEIVNTLPSPWDARIGSYLMMNAAQQMTSLHPDPRQFSPGWSLAVLAGYVVAALGTAAWVITRRDA